MALVPGVLPCDGVGTYATAGGVVCHTSTEAAHAITIEVQPQRERYWLVVSETEHSNRLRGVGHFSGIALDELEMLLSRACHA